MRAQIFAPQEKNLNVEDKIDEMLKTMLQVKVDHLHSQHLALFGFSCLALTVSCSYQILYLLPANLSNAHCRFQSLQNTVFTVNGSNVGYLRVIKSQRLCLITGLYVFNECKTTYGLLAMCVIFI